MRFARSTLLVLALAAGSAGATPEAPKPQEAAPPSLVSAEAPFELFRRPRPEGKVLASVHDEELARWNVGGNSDPAHPSNRRGFHPAVRVVVDTELVSGRLPRRARGQMSEGSLLAVSRSKGYWGFRSCYEAALRRGETDNGATRLRISIRSNGSVSRARVLSSELSEMTGRCLAGEAEAIPYKPAPGTLLGVDVMVKLWPGDAPLPSLQAPNPDPLLPDRSPGELTQELAEKLVEAPTRRIDACYRSALEGDPKLWGRLQLLLMIDERGRLVSVSERDSRFPAPGVVSCASDAVHALALPAPRGGQLQVNVAWRLGQPPSPPS